MRLIGSPDSEEVCFSGRESGSPEEVLEGTVMRFGCHLGMPRGQLRLREGW